MFAWLDKFDTWCAAIWIACISIAIYTLWSAFPWLHQWTPKNSGDLATWIQAFGSLMMLAIALGVPWYEKKKRKKEAAEIAVAFNVLTIANIQVMINGIGENHISAVLKGGYSHQQKLDSMVTSEVIKELPLRMVLAVHAMQVLSDDLKEFLLNKAGKTYTDAYFVGNMVIFSASAKSHSEKIKKILGGNVFIENKLADFGL
ncbi:MAG: hypothetical protein LBV14_11430 [Acidovorax sp.]|jgi:hypothetical protein|nr:hypothetical protein [Acidovorax sp.]